jgi:CheY-like chemotaxis protein
VCRLLIVDDGDDLFELAKVYLSDVGHEIHRANNGVEALQFLAAHENDPPCILLTDLRMPVLDGWDLVYKLKVDPKWMDLPIIVCSASILPGAAPPLLKAKTYWSRRPSKEQLLEVHQYCARHHHSWPPEAMNDAPLGKIAG